MSKDNKKRNQGLQQDRKKRKIKADFESQQKDEDSDLIENHNLQDETENQERQEIDGITPVSDEELEETFDPFSSQNCFLQIFYILIILGGLVFLILYLTGKL